MKKLILLNDVSHLPMQFEANTQDAEFRHFDQFEEGRSKELGLGVDVSMLASNTNTNQADSFDYSDVLSTQTREKKKFTPAAHLEIMELLEEWEEPELQGGDEEVSKRIHTKEQTVHSSHSLSFRTVDYRGDNSSISSSPRIHKGRISVLASVRKRADAGKLRDIGTGGI
jgi:hypothetical protein